VTFRLTNENTAVKILQAKTQFDLVTFRLTNENIAIKILLAKTQFYLVTFRLTNENTAAKILPVGLIMTIRKEREIIVNSPG
jgi:chemotaxis signal transduction protein